MNPWARVTNAATPEQQAQMLAEAAHELAKLPPDELKVRANVLARAQAALNAQAGRLNVVLSPDTAQELARQIAAKLGGLGFLHDLIYERQDLSEIAVNPDGTVWIMKKGAVSFELLDQKPGLDEIWRAVEALTAPLGRSFSEATPSVDARLPRDLARNFSGARLKLLHPVICPGPGQVIGGQGYPSVNIRKYESKPVTPEQVIAWGMAPAAVVNGLVEYVGRAARVLVIGGTASGKTTLLSALAAGIPREARVVKIEDPEEIWLSHPQVVTVEARPAPPGSAVPDYTVKDGVDDAMRMSPRWLIVGEVRKGDAAMALFRAQMSDHPGLSTFHAESPEKTMHRLAVIMFTDLQVKMEAAKEVFVEAVDLIVQVGPREVNGQRKRLVAGKCCARFEARFQECGPRYGPSALAEELGINRQTTSRWANGENAPDFYWLYRLAYHCRHEPVEVFLAVGRRVPDSDFDRRLQLLYMR